MKKTILLTTGAMAAAAIAASGVTPIREWKSTSVSVRAPFMNDSIDVQGQKFRNTDLLSSRMPQKLQNGNIITLTADSAGLLTAERASDPTSGKMTVLQTNIRSERFAKGNISVTSPVPFAILLDGKEVASKHEVDDSVSSSSERKASVRLEPERDYVLSVRLLSNVSDSIAPTVKVVYEPDEEFKNVGFKSSPTMKHRMKLDDTEYANRISSMQFSPDGRFMVTDYYDSYDATHHRLYSTITDMKTGKVVNSNGNTWMNWMPNSNTLYYTNENVDGYDVYFVDPVSGKEELKYTNFPVGRFSWSPDASYIIYTKRADGISESGPLRRYASPDDRIVGDRNRSYLMLYRPETGLAEQITFGNHSSYLNDISPDGKKLLISTSQQDPTTRPFSRSCIYELDLTTMKADTIVAPGPSFVNSAMYSPNGKQLLLTGSAAAFDKIGQRTGKLPIANDYDAQLFIMDRATGKVEAITSEFDPSIESLIAWNRADNKIYFTAAKGFDVPLYVYDPTTKKFTNLDAAVDYVTRASMPEKSARYIAYTGDSYQYAGRGYVLDLKTGKSTLAGAPNTVNEDKIDFGRIEDWNFTSKDGNVIEGIICYPPDFDPEKKYPMIVYYYGGTSPCQRRMLQPYTPELLASRDYIVYILNPSGTYGYGQEFSARHVNAWGEYTTSDIIEGVEKICAEHPFINKDKIGCMGASYGGFTTQYLQTLTPLFAAAVSHAGISNVTSYWGEGYWGYSYNSVAAADSYPWNNPDLFTKHGSLFNADKINTPLLLLHGTADTNVPIGESIQLFNALRILGKDVEFVSVDGENHFISDYPKRQLWQNTIMAWFAKYLQDDPTWWNDLYPERHP